MADEPEREGPAAIDQQANAVDPVVVKFAGNRVRPAPQVAPEKSLAQALLDRQAAAAGKLLDASRRVRQALATLDGRKVEAGQACGAMAGATETSFFPAMTAVTELFEKAAADLEADAAAIEALF